MAFKLLIHSWDLSQSCIWSIKRPLKPHANQASHWASLNHEVLLRITHNKSFNDQKAIKHHSDQVKDWSSLNQHKLLCVYCHNGNRKVKSLGLKFVVLPQIPHIGSPSPLLLLFEYRNSATWRRISPCKSCSVVGKIN